MRFHALNNSSIVSLLMPFTLRRTLVQALIVSLLIHGVLLLRVVNLFPVQMDVPGATINAVIRRDSQGESSKPVSTPVEKPRAKPVKPAAPVVRNTVEKQTVVAEPSPVLIATPPAPATPSEARDAGQHALTSAGAAVRRRVSTEGVATATVPARESISAEDLSQYSISLGRAIRRFRHYPALAKERGWEGTAEVTLNFNALSRMPDVVLFRSSGRAILDEQALAMMTQAVRVTTLPESLKGRDFSVPKSVVFGLNDDQ